MGKQANRIITFAFGLLIMTILTVATTRITDTQISTQNFTSSGQVINFSTNDASIKIWAKDHQYFGNDNGESIELHGTQPDSKPYIGWFAYDPRVGYAKVGWIGCHYNGTAGVHQHCSWETLDNISGTMTVNTHFEIGYNANGTNAQVEFPNSDVVFTNNQNLYFGGSKNATIRYTSVSDSLTASAKNFQFGSTNVYTTTGNLQVGGSGIILNASGTANFKINRNAVTDWAQIQMFTNNAEKWDIQMRGDTTDNLYISDIVNSKRALIFVPGSSPQVKTGNQTLFIIQANVSSTAMICNAANEGAIYYDHGTLKHYGCDGTNWNALY